jgi:hypothetical protein
MRRALFLVLSLAAGVALAQQQARPKLEPLPEPPPPPRGSLDAVDDPRVLIRPQDGDVVEEVRENGRVTMIKVTPPGGVPYYLVDTTGQGNWMRRESTDSGNRVPMWQIKSFD